MVVYCVLCIDDDVTHIFSTAERAQQFADTDPRDHVLYDYLVDYPERFEQVAQ